MYINSTKERILEIVYSALQYLQTYTIKFIYYTLSSLSVIMFILALLTYASLGVIVIAILYMGVGFNKLAEIFYEEK